MTYLFATPFLRFSHPLPFMWSAFTEFVLSASFTLHLQQTIQSPPNIVLSDPVWKKGKSRARLLMRPKQHRLKPRVRLVSLPLTVLSTLFVVTPPRLSAAEVEPAMLTALKPFNQYMT